MRLLGEIVGAKIPLRSGAENHYRQALALAEEHLTTATAMMRDMQVGVWLEKAEAEPSQPFCAGASLLPPLDQWRSAGRRVNPSLCPAPRRRLSKETNSMFVVCLWHQCKAAAN